MYNAELKLKQDGTLRRAGLQLGWPHQVRAVTPVPCPAPRVLSGLSLACRLLPWNVFPIRCKYYSSFKSCFRSCFPCEVPSTLWLLSFLGRINLFFLRLHQSLYCEDATLYIVAYLV